LQQKFDKDKFLSTASVTFTHIFSKRFLRSYSLFATANIVAHEYGHYNAAKYFGTEPTRPKILGVAPVYVGFVKAKKTTKENSKTIHIYGPITALAACSFMFAFSLYIGSQYLTLLILTLMLNEMYNLLLGTDGVMKFR
jgi:hypothetical protein